jgi:hypothetical protein
VGGGLLAAENDQVKNAGGHFEGAARLSLRCRVLRDAANGAHVSDAVVTAGVVGLGLSGRGAMKFLRGGKGGDVWVGHTLVGVSGGYFLS